MKIGVDIDDTLAQTTNYLMPLAIKFDKDILHKNGIVDSKKIYQDVLTGIMMNYVCFLEQFLKMKY